ncbi:HET-domain-containing protein [Fusarium austroafricanum]|uniref:HET-domain-containing protein n=1 Tax=Fusarium austroafricanum TaxID=2364996 RepID=A0A8H4P7W1_9HYPO|nr:HET-domain-containing protein [Fusarium austroafricanum]
MSLANSAGSSQRSKESCDVCAALEKLFTNDNVNIDIRDEWQDYGKYCAGHSSLLQWIESKCREGYDRLKKAHRIPSTDGYEVSVIFFLREGGGIPRVYVRNAERYWRYQILLHTKSRSGVVKGYSPISVLDPEWVDLTIAKTWMKRCIAEHTSKCESSLIEQVSPAWVIDTKDGCLVPGNDSRPFVALSYRWGSLTTRQMGEAAFKNMATPGSLLQDNAFLTPTVKDAIYTVREIGERYLWVDAICLAPNNEKQLAEQLQLMGAIYASAKLTIVALDGDASTGLKGLQSQSPPRTLPNIFPWKDDKSLLARHLPPLTVENLEASRYFERGWTFQEYILSPRRLIFGNQQVHWQCSCSEWHEDLPNTEAEEEEDISDLDKTYTEAFSNIKKGLLDFKDLGLLISEYNRRELTYPEDAFPAFNGLLKYLEKFSFKQGFLFGLPIANFDAALMWSCAFGMHAPRSSSQSGLRRRQRSARHYSVLPGTYLPSWSWIGWKGEGIKILEKEAQSIWSDSLLDIAEGDPTFLLWHSVITTPITQWYSHTSPDGNGKQPIPRYPTVYNKDSELSYDQEVWTRRELVSTEDEDGMALLTQIGVRHLYEHINFPGRRFLWPLPQMNPVEESTQPNLEQNPFISGRTKRAWFRALRYHEYNHTVRMDMHLSLLDRHRRLCGWIQLPNNEESLNFPEANFAEDIDTENDIPLAMDDTFLKPFPERRHLVELVAICLSKHPYRLPKGISLGLKEFYGVLWVEWTDGVAYRRGCGYVNKELWDEQDAEDVDLVLG